MTFRLLAITSALVAVVTFSLPAAEQAPLTNLSSQSIQVGPGGVRVDTTDTIRVGATAEYTIGLNPVDAAVKAVVARPSPLKSDFPAVV